MAGAINPFDVVVRPVVSEKAQGLTDSLNQYVFEVDVRANKIQIKEAIELIFKVEVLGVNTLVMPPKRGRRGRRVFIRSKKWKKAIVMVKPGQKIALFS